MTKTPLDVPALGEVNTAKTASPMIEVVEAGRQPVGATILPPLFEVGGDGVVALLLAAMCFALAPSDALADGSGARSSHSTTSAS